MKLPRIMLAAPASGSGKTMVTCGILMALVNRGVRAASFKCGPDYIDPMFHGRVIGVPSKNLDTYFTTGPVTRMLFGKEAARAEISVLEGVMGYYDGVAGTTVKASAYDLARVTETPVILVVDAKGMSLSVGAVVKGFLEFRKDSRIKGIILNRMSPMLYPRIKEILEQELSIRVLGYVPELKECRIESRHLGLVTPDEITGLKERLNRLAAVLKETLDLDLLLRLARDAPDFTWDTVPLPRLAEKVRIGIARDEAFCFMYRDNLELLEEMGAELSFFSPLHEERLPKALHGLIFYGGYPELHAEKLSHNLTIIKDIQKAAAQGMPYLAECGGFMYLHQTLRDMEGQEWPMAGILPGQVFYTGRLNRFGYVSLRAECDNVLGNEGASIRGHEFHYFDSTQNGADFVAEKPNSPRGWSCIHGDEGRAVGFPHLYYYSNPDMIYHFLNAALQFKKKR